ncbi:MAG: hypothetical protein WBR29_07445 [Gammaproteobacteria bacterium]
MGFEIQAVPPMKLHHDKSRYSGLDLRQNDLRYMHGDKDWSLTLFNNQHGTFEATFYLTRDDAEAMRDWLNDLLAKLGD